MPKLRLSIVRFVDGNQPGWVECHLFDALGALHRFVEKIPVVSREDLWIESTYPQLTEIEVTLIARWRDDDGGMLVEIDTDAPHGIESTNRKTRFVVRGSDVFE